MVALIATHFSELFCLQAGAQILSPQLPAGEQILVLKNGSFVTGLIEQFADHYSVQTLQGSRLVIDNKKTDFVCNSLNEAYWGKLARTAASDTNAQTQLFHWCVQHDLLTEAHNQIEVLLATGYDLDRLAYFRRQLEIAILQIEKPKTPPEKSQSRELNTETELAIESPLNRPTTIMVPGANRFRAMTAETATPDGDFFAELDPIFTPLPALTSQLAIDTPKPQPHVFKTIRLPDDSTPSEIAQVTYAEPISDESQEITTTLLDPDIDTIDSHPTLSAYQSPAVHELDSFTRDLPPGSLGRFRQQVERILVRQCSECHTADGAETEGALPLVHAGKTQPLSRRMTQRNMHAVYHYVDRQQPLSSRLLTAATNMHGGINRVALPLETDEYQRLREWLISISENPSQTDLPAEPARFSQEQLQSDFNHPFKAKPIKFNSESLQPTSDRDTGFPPTIGEIPNLDSPPAAFQPRDEFDPEIFNRMN
jgi:hypothetical protein